LAYRGPDPLTVGDEENNAQDASDLGHDWFRHGFASRLPLSGTDVLSSSSNYGAL